MSYKPARKYKPEIITAKREWHVSLESYDPLATKEERHIKKLPKNLKNGW